MASSSSTSSSSSSSSSSTTTTITTTSPPVQADWESGPAPTSWVEPPSTSSRHPRGQRAPRHPRRRAPYSSSASTAAPSPHVPAAPRTTVVAVPMPEGGYASDSVDRWRRFTTTASLRGSSSSSTAVSLRGSSSSSTAAPTMPSPALNCSLPASLDGSSSSSAASPTTPSPALSCSLPAALGRSPSSAPSSEARLSTMFAPPHVSSSTGTWATFFSSISATAEAASSSRQIFAPLSTTSDSPSMTASGATPPLGSMACSAASVEIFAPLSTSTTSAPPSMTVSGATPLLGSMASSAPTSSSVHAQTNAAATDQAQPTSSFGPSVWSSEWWPNIPFMEQNEEQQDGDIQNDDTEQGEIVRRVAESAPED